VIRKSFGYHDMQGLFSSPNIGRIYISGELTGLEEKEDSA